MPKRILSPSEILKAARLKMAKKGVSSAEIESMIGPAEKEIRQLGGEKEQVEEALSEMKRKLGLDKSDGDKKKSGRD